MSETVCPSCLTSAVCQHEWNPEVERPAHVVDDPICADCHASLRRVAGQDENPLEGMPTPAPDSDAAIAGLMRMSMRGPRPR